MKVIAVLILYLPTVWEVWDDKIGDTNKRFDVFVRACLMVAVSLVCYLLFKVNFWASLNLSVAILFALFDYMISYVLIRNKIIEPRIGGGYSWFSVTGKQGWFDNLKLWKFASPWVRFGIKLAYLIISLVLFFTL